LVSLLLHALKSLRLRRSEVERPQRGQNRS
jgi:hypothetical protein